MSESWISGPDDSWWMTPEDYDEEGNLDEIMLERKIRCHFHGCRTHLEAISIALEKLIEKDYRKEERP